MSKMQLDNVVNTVNQLIMEQLSEPVLIEQLADSVGLSKFHLHRLFAAQTGFEIAEYIQRRKMETALSLVKQGRLSVIDIALEVGYESHSSFSRVFKQAFGATPSQVMKGEEVQPLIQYKKKPKQHTESVDTQWLFLPERKILGLYCRGFEQQSFARVANLAYEQLTEQSQYKDYLNSEPVGVSLSNPWTAPEDAEFFCGFMRGLDSDCESGLEVYIRPAGHYIFAEYTGPYQQMWQFISKLHSQWIESNKVVLAKRQVIQRYLNHPQSTAPDELKTQLYFQVEKILD